jgi:phosphate butyryltransferase
MPTAENKMQMTPATELHDLRARARALANSGAKPKVAVVAAEDDVALSAAAAALELGIAIPILIGHETRLRFKAAEIGLSEALDGAETVSATPEEAAQVAVSLVREGKADVLLKGHLRTDELLRAVLDREHGLRTGRLLSDVLLYEDKLSGTRRLVAVTDGGINVAPGFEQKQQIILNAIEAMHALGFARPKIAVMSATEAVSESVPSTVDAQKLTAWALEAKLEADVYGPLALDNALLMAAAEAKGINHPVAGRADVMVMPNIESGNLLGKGVKYLGGSECAHVIVGAKAPVLIPSRVESVDDKVNSIAFGILVANAR